MATPVKPDEAGSPTEDRRDAPAAATPLVAQKPGIHTAVEKSSSDSTLVQMVGAGALKINRRMKKLCVQSACEPSLLEKQSGQRKLHTEKVEDLKYFADRDGKHELEDTPQKVQPDFDEMDGDAFGNSNELPAELEKDLLGIKGVTCFGIGVLCERCPLVIYCSPKFKDEAWEALTKIHDGPEKKRFMVVIWQDISIRGSYGPTFTGKDTLGLSSSDYSSALGLPVTVNGREALLGTFHCLMGQLLYTLPAVRDKKATPEDDRKTLAPFKDSMYKTGDDGLKKLLETLLELAAPGVTPSKYVKYVQEELRLCHMLLRADVFDVSPDTMKLHIKCPDDIRFMAYCENSRNDAEVGIEAIGVVPKSPSFGEVAVYFTNGKGINVDVSHPESASQPSMVQQNENLEPRTRVVWKRGPVSGETTGKVVYTCMTYKVQTPHMRDFTLRGAVGVKHNVEADHFAKVGDSSAVVYLKKDSPKLLGAISAVAEFGPGDEWLWTYDDCRADGYLALHNTGNMVRTKGFTLVVPYFNQFQVVKDHLGYDIEVRSQ